MIVEVESNENCEQSIFARFKEAGPPRLVLQIRSFERHSAGEWCSIIGWTDDPEHAQCPVYVQLVEDSGAGLTHLVFGGIWGLRLKPLSVDEDWDLTSPNQWGEPYLSLADSKDIRYADE